MNVQNLVTRLDVNGHVVGDAEDTRIGVEVLVQSELEDGRATIAIVGSDC